MTQAVQEYQEPQQQPFNPHLHLMKIKNKNGATDYLPVQWRLVWFREQCPQGTIETEVITIDLDRETEEETYAWNDEKRRSEKVLKRAPGYALFKAVVKDGKGGVATGYKSEKAASFPDYIEKAETGAIGRALAALGYGTQFAPELDEEHRIVDAPVEPPAQPYRPKRTIVEADSPQAPTKPVAPRNVETANHSPVATQTPSAPSQTVKDVPTLDIIRVNFFDLYQFKEEEKEGKWIGFKAVILGMPVEDAALTAKEIERLHKAVEFRMQKH